MEVALSVTFGDSSPKGGASGVSGHFLLDAESPIWRKRAGLATEGRLPFVGKSGSWHRFLYLFVEVYGILILRPCPPILFGREVKAMSSILSFVLSVGANVTSYYICKWLDRWFTGRKH